MSSRPRTFEDDLGLGGTVFFIVGAILASGMNPAIQGIGGGLAVAGVCCWVGAFGRRKGWPRWPRAWALAGLLLGGAIAAGGIVVESRLSASRKADAGGGRTP